jgi:hypothetical protein
MKTFKEFLTEESEVKEVTLDEESTASSTLTGGVEMPAAPMFKKTTVFGKPCIEVDSDTYHACVKGKIPFKRWTGYVTDDGLRDEMKKMFYKNKRLMIQDSNSGAMAYLK